jgi:hypothetical protein
MVTGPKQPEGQPGAAERGGVSRRKLLMFTGATSLTAALAAACSGDKYPAENKPASPSTANIPMETADAQPTQTPTPETAEQKPLPRPEQIVSREKIEELFTLPNWNETLKDVKKNGGGEKAAADVIATRMVEVVNGILNPVTLVDEAKITGLGLGKHADSGDMRQFCKDLQRYVIGEFSELAIVDDTKGSIPEFLASLERGGTDDTFIALLEKCGQPESLAGENQFSRKLVRQKNTDGQEVLYYTDFPTNPHIKRIETTVDVRENLNPKPDSGVCQEIDRELQNGNNSKRLTFDFTPPEEDGSMKLVDLVIERL